MCKKLVDNYSAYSSLTVLPDGTVGCFVEEDKWDSNIPGENGFRLYFMKFTLEWLTDGSDTGNSNIEGHHSVKITNPAEGTGTLEVFDGETKILNGRKVAEGTTLTVVATPTENYLLKEVCVNGNPIETTDNAGSFVVDSETTVSATFERDPNAPLDYCEPTPHAGHTYASTASTRRTDRMIKEFVVTDGTNSITVAGGGNTAGRKVYVGRTGSLLSTKAGSTVSLVISGSNNSANSEYNLCHGEWMNTFIYVDFDRNGFTMSDKVFGNVTGSCNTYFGTFEFNVPENTAPGTYRVRHKVDWDPGPLYIWSAGQ